MSTPSLDNAADALRTARETRDRAFAAFAAELHRTGIVRHDAGAVGGAYLAADEAYRVAREAYLAARAAA